MQKAQLWFEPYLFGYIIGNSFVTAALIFTYIKTMVMHYFAFKRALAEYKNSGSPEELIQCFINLKPEMNSYEMHEMFSKPDVRRLLDYLVYHIMN